MSCYQQFFAVSFPKMINESEAIENSQKNPWLAVAQEVQQLSSYCRESPSIPDSSIRHSRFFTGNLGCLEFQIKC